VAPLDVDRFLKLAICQQLNSTTKEVGGHRSRCRNAENIGDWTGFTVKYIGEHRPETCKSVKYLEDGADWVAR